GKELREGLNRNQRIAHFVRHACCQVGPKGRSVQQLLFLTKRFLRGQILDNRDCAQRLLLVNETTGLDRKRPPRMGVDPLLGGKLDLAFDRFAQKGSDAAAGCFNGPIQNVGRRDAEDRLSRRVAPTDDPLLIARDNPRGDGGEECFSKRFLQGDLFAKTSIFQHGRDLVTEAHEHLETLLIERLTGKAVAKKKPAADSSTSVQRHDYLRANGVECSPEKLVR